MRKSQRVMAVLVAVMALVGLVGCTTSAGRDASSSPPTAASGVQVAASASDRSATIPARVRDTLAKIDAGTWPSSAKAPGTKGGTSFSNREGRLPKSAQGKAITYREWDVNPKARGRGRDAERIVTGSDGSAWYTADHYRTFTRIR